jgi:hypothetical protein
MPVKPLDRLMFVQGGLCFFCEQPLPKAEASVEHLLASANGGSNSDENCVACCKAVNALLGSMSLKEKLRVVLNQKGSFKCPNGAGSSGSVAQKKTTPKALAQSLAKEDRIGAVLANLKQRGKAKPRTLKTLTSTIATLFPAGMPDPELSELVKQLQLSGNISVVDDKVTYTF